MYTFQPLVDVTYNSHTGFYVWVVAAVLLMAIFIGLWNEREASGGFVLTMLVMFGIVTHVGYQASYQDAKVYVNTPVSATLVGFQPEGYSEKSGKTRADRHYMYVVYDVGDERVILRADEGRTYPNQTVLYKN